MYKQVLDPVGHSLGLTSIFAVLPLLTLFVLLGVVRMKAWLASVITLGVAIVIALAVYSMPVGQTGDAALEGAVFGFWPIMWIVINALWIFNMSDATGHFAVLRRAFSDVSNDQRVQVIMVAFCFGALIEGIAGFGASLVVRHRRGPTRAAAPGPHLWRRLRRPPARRCHCSKFRDGRGWLFRRRSGADACVGRGSSAGWWLLGSRWWPRSSWRDGAGAARPWRSRWSSRPAGSSTSASTRAPAPRRA